MNDGPRIKLFDGVVPRGSSGVRRAVRRGAPVNSVHYFLPVIREIQQQPLDPAFRLEGEDSVWIGEQEIYKGPGEYTTVDGTFFEQISLTYELQRVSGHRLNHLNITYSGEDSRMAGRNDLRLQEVVPILREWGYDVERIGGVRQSRVSSR